MSSENNTLKPEELARYSRHMVLPQVGREGQERLRRARVLVIGAGGLGSPAALYLAAAGVGTLGVADFDSVEAHNLQRQVIHGTEDIGTEKTAAAARRLRSLNPHVRVRIHADGIRPENSLAVFSEYDVVVDGTDNFSARYLNNDTAHLSGKPLIYGSIFRFEGQISVFDTRAGGPCYRCLFPEPPPPDAVPNCAEAGVFGALPGVIGSLQAIETIKCLLDIGTAMRGRLLVFDALETRFRTLQLKRDPDCPLCGDRPRIRNIAPDAYAFSCNTKIRTETNAAMHSSNPRSCPMEISIEETKHLLEDDSAGVLLLDVREPHEREICRIENSKAIPMAEIPENLDALPRERRILVYCHHGGRSLRVTRFLRDKGFSSVSNISGGIDAWAKTYDPAMPRY